MEKSIKYKKPDLFFIELKEKVYAYMSQNNLKTSGGWAIKLKALILFCLWIIIYLLINFGFGNDPPWIWILILYPLLGITFSLIGFNVMHDASHGTFSKNKKVNDFVLLIHESLQGASSFIWEPKHIVIHHSHTNTEDDEDLEGMPFLRLSTHDPIKPWHKFQVYYAFLLYGMLFFVWVFMGDFRKFIKKKIKNYTIPNKKYTTKAKWRFWVTKIIFFCTLIVSPIIFIGWAKAIIGFLSLCFICGVFLSVIFQLAHVIETSSFPKTDIANTKRIDKTWSENQFAETSNFATQSKLASWLLGGLNFQIEHHLFPKISHIHYPQIAPIVKEFCKNKNIQYNELTFSGAVISHIKMLHKLGKPYLT